MYKMEQWNKLDTKVKAAVIFIVLLCMVGALIIVPIDVGVLLVIMAIVGIVMSIGFTLYGVERLVKYGYKKWKKPKKQ